MINYHMFLTVNNTQATIYAHIYSSPHCSMATSSLGLLFAPVGTFSILRTTSSESSSMTYQNSHTTVNGDNFKFTNYS